MSEMEEPDDMDNPDDENLDDENEDDENTGPMVDDPDLIDLHAPFIRLGKDLKEAAVNLRRDDARWLVDEYYTIQDARIRSAAQVRTHAEDLEPHRLISWVKGSMTRFEGAIKTSLGEFARVYAVGQWLQSIYGIGPVLSACCLANFDIRKAPTVGHMWRFAGLDPTRVWLGKEKAEAAMIAVGVGKGQQPTDDQIRMLAGLVNYRDTQLFEVATEWNKKTGRAALVGYLSRRPWNAQLKSIMVYKMGECYVRFQNRKPDHYGHLFAAKKKLLKDINAAGGFADRAKAELDSPKAARMRKDAKRLEHWKAGKLAPAHIHDTARRWVVKLFMSHLHEVMYWDWHGSAPPAPYIFEHPELGDHRHKMLVPNWPLKGVTGKSLRSLLD